MDFDLQNIMDWFEDNMHWLLIPLCVNVAVVLIGFILLLITGKDVNTVIKFLFILLLFASPFIGYFLGDYLDEYLGPMFSSVLK